MTSKKDNDKKQIITSEKNIVKDDFSEHKKILMSLNYNIFKENEVENISGKTYVGNINIDSFLSLKNIKIRNLSKLKEIYFLGENGSGKTILLQSITISMIWPFVENFAQKKFLGKMIDLFKFDENLRLSSYDNKKRKYHITGNRFLKNIFAYGVNRGYSKFQEVEPYGFSSLFTSYVSLIKPDAWLKEIYAKELEVKQKNLDLSTVSLSTIIQLIKEVLGDNVDIEVSIISGVRYIERGKEINFESLSEGYKTVLIWVIDLLSRLIENQPEATSIQDFYGIVLVDEINLHLHPKWEYTLVKKLRQWFPKIQFIFTTHSPITVLGASKDAIFYRLYKENGETHISEPYTAKWLQSLMANAIITSPLFDLDTARMRSFDQAEDKLDTSSTFLVSRIDMEVEKRIKELKQAGKIYLSVDDIDQVIQQALDELDIKD